MTLSNEDRLSLYELLQEWGFSLVYEKDEFPFKIVSIVAEFGSEEEVLKWMKDEWEIK